MGAHCGLPRLPFSGIRPEPPNRIMPFLEPLEHLVKECLAYSEG